MNYRFILYDNDFYVVVGIGSNSSPTIYSPYDDVFSRESYFEAVLITPYKNLLKSKLSLDSVVLPIDECKEIVDKDVIEVLMVLYEQ